MNKQIKNQLNKQTNKEQTEQTEQTAEKPTSEKIRQVPKDQIE